MGEETFLGRIEIDVLHEHEGGSGFTTMAKPDPNERLDHLPEPWRKHAAKRLAELRARIRETLRATAYKVIVLSITYRGSHRSEPPGFSSFCN